MQTIGEREPMDGDLGRFYDAIENPRATRNELPILRGDELRAYMEGVRERTLEVLDEIELTDTDDRLLRDGFVYELILAHELQHNETMLQLLQMVDDYEPAEGRGRISKPPGPRHKPLCSLTVASTRSAPERMASRMTMNGRATP